MPRIEKVMLLIAGVSIAAGVVIGFGHRNASPEAKGQLTAEQAAELNGPPAPPPQATLTVTPVQQAPQPAQEGSVSAEPEGGEESGAEDGSGS
jgi:hypothetical protein